MRSRLRLSFASAVCLGAAFLVAGCRDDSQAPTTRPETPVPDSPEASALGPVDLIYICGNKFLVTNATPRPVEVTYRVSGTDETGNLNLLPNSGRDEGSSETELETTERGVVELYQGDDRVARRQNNGLACGAAAVGGAMAVGAVGPAGQWTAPFPWANVAVHLSLLPDGKVLSFGLSGTPQVWNPATGGFTSVPSPSLLFCAGHAFLPDGRLLVAGGNNHPTEPANGLPNVNIFNPVTRSWTASVAMRKGRWYPTNTMLANGDVVIMAGKDEVGTTVREPEVWSSGSLRVLSTAGMSLPLYPRTFLAPNGKIFYAGETSATKYLDPTGTGSWSPVATRKYGQRDYGSAVMYDDGKILYVGGGRTTNTAEIIDLNAATPAWQWTGSMAFARRHLNATMLPTGDVLVTGGTSGITFSDEKQPIHAAELWNPTTGVWTTLASNTINRVYHSTSLLLPDGRILHTGSGDAGTDQRNAELFSPPYLFLGSRPTLSTAPAVVGYGTSFSVSTPDASSIAKVSLIRIGSVTHAFDMNQRFQWLSFVRGAGQLTISAPTSRNRAPPGHYLLFILNGQGVPSVGKIIRMGDGGPTEPPPSSSIVLSATGSATATVQSMSLKWTGAGGTSVDIYRNGVLLRTTANDGSDSNGRTFHGAATYVFKVCEAGTSVCSNLATVEFGGGTANTAPTASFGQSCSSLACTFTDSSIDGDGSVVSWQWTFGDGTTSTTRHPAHTYATGGTYSVTLKVTDDDGATNQWSTTVTVSSAAASIALTATGRSDATTQSMSLKWSGARGTTVDVYRNGKFLRNTANDGSDSNGRTFQGPATYLFKVCEAGTIVCSDVARVEFNGGSLPPNVPPTANFASSCVGLSCSFTDTSADWDGAVATWQWTFEDGSTSTDRNPSRTYSAAGDFPLTLAIRDNANATATTTKTVTVSAPPLSNQPPTASFTWNCTGLTCAFTDGSSDDDGVAGWSWDFGDNTGTASEADLSHTFGTDGTYSVSLTVTDEAGLTGTATHTVSIPLVP